MKSGRLSGHVVDIMIRNGYRILVGKHEAMRARGRQTRIYGGITLKWILVEEVGECLYDIQW
jgi:hypothetical protein